MERLWISRSRIVPDEFLDPHGIFILDKKVNLNKVLNSLSKNYEDKIQKLKSRIGYLPSFENHKLTISPTKPTNNNEKPFKSFYDILYRKLKQIESKNNQLGLFGQQTQQKFEKLNNLLRPNLEIEMDLDHNVYLTIIFQIRNSNGKEVFKEIMNHIQLYDEYWDSIYTYAQQVFNNWIKPKYLLDKNKLF